VRPLVVDVMRVLVVDDEFSIAETCADVLRWEGFEADVVADGAEALAAIRARRPDLVLLDYMMPVMDGLELLQQLRADAELRDVRVVLMTAARLSLPPEKRTWNGLLLKPFNADQLLSAVRQQLVISSL
jgi:CheY-like chemotaxis protein